MIVNPQPLFVTLTLIIVVFITSIKLTVGYDNLKCIESERQALLSFKHDLMNPPDILSTWRDENEDCCHWRGVQCDNLTNHIIELDLHSSFIFDGSKGKIGNSLVELSHLRYLDLSFNSFIHSSIPSYIGSFVNLVYLNLSYNWFSGIIPPHFSNLSSLHTLDVSGCPGLKNSESLEWLSHLSALQYLDLSWVSLENARDWMQVINKLPHLESLGLSYCHPPPPILPSYPYINNISSSLSKLDLSYNYPLTSLIFQWVSNFSTNLVYLDLSENNLQGKFSDLFQTSLCCAQNSLQYLTLDHNKLSGPLPNFSTFPNLKLLDLSSNEFSGTIPISLGQLSNLETLSLEQNSLEGSIFEAHFSELTKLRVLNLGYNSLNFHVQSYWVPPFQLDRLYLSSCMLGPKFPNWLQGQNLSRLDISNASISDTIPHWFWNFVPNLERLDLSENKIRGELPTLFMNFTERMISINLRSNEFKGQIPLFLPQLVVLDISNNKFSGSNLFCRISNSSSLQFLDVSNNELLEELPSCWENLQKLEFLSLAHNRFFGELPSSLSNLSALMALHLHNNNLSGELPSWLKNLRGLLVLDLGANNFSGPIPSWVGNELRYLNHLSLRSNQLYGQLPSSLCHLNNINFLDLSLNHFTGGIPDCIHNLTSLTSSGRTFPEETFVIVDVHDHHFDEMTTTWKGKELIMKSISLGLFKGIDLSGNHLTGKIPNEITNLTGLVSLNLSRNNLMGGIPQKIGQFKVLESLDLSRNELVGHIPSSLSQISGLSVLDLSYNKLSGEIPIGTQLQSFNESAYQGNIELCGSPLPRCPEEESILKPSDIEDKANQNEFLTHGFYISLALGFVVGFWGICGALIFNRSWRYAYFKFLDDLDDWFSIKKTIFKNKVGKLFKD